VLILKNALIVNLTSKNSYSFVSLIAALEINGEIENVDIILSNPQNLINDVKNAALTYQKLCVAFSFSTPAAKEVSSYVKSIKQLKNVNCFLIAGGPHPSGAPIETLKMGFDTVVIGEGENVLPMLLKYIFSDSPLDNLPGVGFIKNGNPKLNFKRDEVDLDKFPTFAWKHKLYRPFEISRGCPYGCYYCQCTYLFGRRMRHRSISRIIEEAKKILKLKKRWDFRFISPNALAYGSDGFSPNVSKLQLLLKNIRKIEGDKRIFFGTFPSEVRPEFVSEKTLEPILKYADNTAITIGAQSGSQRILDAINRQHTVSDIYEAVETALKCGFTPNLDIIFGLPGETPEDQKQTLKMIKYFASKGVKAHLHYFIPLPGTPFWRHTPSPISNDVKKELGKLIRERKAFGAWISQQSYSAQISNTLEN